MSVKDRVIYKVTCGGLTGSLEVALGRTNHGNPELVLMGGMGRNTYFYPSEWPEVCEAIEHAVEDSKHKQDPSCRREYTCAGSGWVSPIRVSFDKGDIYITSCNGWQRFNPKRWGDVRKTIERALGTEG